MKREEFLGPYRSRTVRVGGHLYYVRGHSPWVERLFDPEPQIHEMARWMLTQEAKYDHRWHWWSLRVPPPLFTMHMEKVEEAGAGGIVIRVVARLIALYAAWRSLPRR